MLLFFCNFRISLNFQCSEKNMGLVSQVNHKLLTPKDVLIYMDNRACFWKSFGSEHVNESQKLLKSLENYFYPNFSSFWARLSLEKLFLIRSEISGPLVNTWLPTTSILVVIGRIYRCEFKTNYLKNHNFFPSFFLQFWNIH